MILATIKKDTLILLRDRGALASLFLLPVAFITVFGLMFSGQDDGDGQPKGSRKQPVAVYAPAGNDEARAVLADLESSTVLAPRRVDSEAELDRLVVAKDVSAGLSIPVDFDPDRKKPLVLVIDPALPDNERFGIEGPIQGAIVGNWFKRKFGLGTAGGLGPEPSAFLSPRAPAGLRKKAAYADGFQVTVPSNAVLFCFFNCIAVALSFIEERKRGTWRRLLAAPIARRTVLAAKLVPFFVIGVIQMTFLFLVGSLLFGMHVSGSFPALALVTLSLVASSTGLGFLVASFGGSERQVASITSIAVLIMGLVAGCMFPRFLMPEAFQTASLAVPHGWALDAYRDVLIREGTTASEVLIPSLILVGFGAGYALLGSLFFRFEK